MKPKIPKGVLAMGGRAGVVGEGALAETQTTPTPPPLLPHRALARDRQARSAWRHATRLPLSATLSATTMPAGIAGAARRPTCFKLSLA